MIRGNRLGVGFDFDRDLDLLANEHSTGLEGGIVVEPEVRAVDFGGSGVTQHLLAPRIGALAIEFGIQHNLVSHATNREIAGHLEIVALGFDAGALEGQGREVLRIEEIRRAEVRIALLFTRVDTGGADFDIDARVLDVLVVEL